MKQKNSAQTGIGVPVIVKMFANVGIVEVSQKRGTLIKFYF